MSTKQNSKDATQSQLPPDVDEGDVVAFMNQGCELASIASALEEDVHIGNCFLPSSYGEKAEEANRLLKEAVDALRKAAILLLQSGPDCLRRQTDSPLILFCSIYDLRNALALSKYDPDTLGHCMKRSSGRCTSRSESASVLLNNVLEKLLKEYDRIERGILR